jgi:FKBP-type peptidyl-prolyl cis-trans isomerase (trigger factor)
MEKGNMIRERLEEQVTSDVTTRVNPSHLDSYLNDLEVQAIERGSVTFEDVRTGAELIRKYSSNQAPKIVQQQLNDFFLRMEILTHQLLNVSTEISASPSELLQQISATEEGITLPPEEFTKALEKLEELSQTENSNENASQIGELLREAENSQDEADRQRLIEESLRLIKEMDKRAD